MSNSGGYFALEDGSMPSGKRKRIRSSEYELMLLFTFIISSSLTVYYYQYQSLPSPVPAEEAGPSGFSEVEALKHVEALSQLGPHSVGSDALDTAVKYVYAVAENISKTANPNVDVQVQLFHVNSGVNQIDSGRFTGKSLVYADLNHVLLRILPKRSYASNSEAEDNAILVSAHIDTVFAAPGSGDDTSNVAVMLEIARGISQSTHELKNGVVFLFNTAEEEGLNGAHSFVTQHPWIHTIRLAIDLEAMGLGGKSGVFQAGPNPFAIENYASAAKYPSGGIVTQDLFQAGAVSSATDFQVYTEVAGLSGLDFAFTDNSNVYHTKNDKLEFLKPGSLQHLGENMLAFLLQASPVPELQKGKAEEKSDDDIPIYFDILGSYMVVYHQSFASMLYNSVITLSLVIWGASLYIGGYPAVISLILSSLSAILMLVFSIIFSLLVAFILPQVSSSPVPYVAYPCLAIGLFAAPALAGALIGQHLGYLILQFYLSHVYSDEKPLSSVSQSDLAKLQAERWLFKSGFVVWLVLLIIGNYYKVGSSFIALAWLFPPAVAYGLLEASLIPSQISGPLKPSTLVLGLAVPIVISAGTFIRLPITWIGNVVRSQTNPGSSPEWQGSLPLALIVAVFICLSLIYFLSYVHLSGAIRTIIVATSLLFGFTFIAVASGVVPPFTEERVKAVNVVHVFDYGNGQVANSYVSLFSTTPGKLTKEAEEIDEGFSCGRGKVIDFVTFSVKYGCWAHDDAESNVGWSARAIPTLSIVSDTNKKGKETQARTTKIIVDPKGAARWALGINSEEIEDFSLRTETEELISFSNKTSVDGWYTVRFAGGKASPTIFELNLSWGNAQQTEEERPLVKLRADFEELTPKVKRILDKLPKWCSQYGKSTSPKNLVYLSSLPVNF